MMYCLFEHCLFSDKYKRIIFVTSKYSFGIYLVHPFFLDILFRYMNVSLDVYRVPLVSIAICLISLFCLLSVDMFGVKLRYVFSKVITKSKEV